jgi:phosphopantothenoylcysteine synthetase/decarboxylase
LACGDVGDGAMMEWRKIVETVSSHFATDRDGKAVMV